ncbi:hypothetical protein BS50DRAFT_586473 [Corynespora cassiicola Philippines]|uniref:DUF8212 domain-containing protein n=1 Tax=Corynespora cassiicola Philippines TaxID=1448308 RepID=A0A2T2NUQ4_CORCC|nr:hypothetical protein BS50DRAFT_586473 [Corynespora cassiicola Philippines]
MPLPQGEGYRAFYRLQQEIMRRTNDHSIFAWPPQGRHVLGMLAPPPEFFSAAQGIVSQNSVQSGSFEVTNNWLRIGLDYVTPVATPDQRILVLLNCRNADCGGRLHRDPSTGPEHITYNHIPSKTAYGEMYILAETDPKNDSSRKTCNTSIEELVLKPKILHSQHALVGLGSLVDVVALHSCGDNGDILCFPDDEYGGILIEDRFSSWTFLIAFGQYEHYPMFRVVEGFLFAEARARLSQIFRDMCRAQRLNLEQDPNSWKRSECHLQWLSNDFVVIATVRKKRKSGSISWAWTVSVKHSESYEAVCFSQNNEASPADEDTKLISRSQSNLNETRHRLVGIWASHKSAVTRRVQEKFKSLR